MGKGGEPAQKFTKEDVALHSNWKKNDAWLSYRGNVYDFSKWAKKHPGGNVISLYSGQDATTAMERFHKDKPLLDKWLKPLYIGELTEEAKAKDAITADFDRLTEELKEEGYFESNKWFYIGMLAHICVMEYVAYLYVSTPGMMEWGGSFGYWCLALLLCTAQAQSGWLQHDFGHCSVFESTTWNYYAHQFTIAHMKAASKHWWNSRHSRHHAKPNVVQKDPDCDTPLPLFLFGEAYFEATRWYIPAVIPFQKYLWFVLGPPMVTTVLFVVQTIYYMIARKKHWDLFWVTSYFVRFGFTFGSYLGFTGCLKLYFATRVIETQWFTWVTSMNHLPMPIHKDCDSPQDWFSLQVTTTQNIKPGWFNDWFTGHLNYQIEHHLWPTMPRHNYYAIHHRVKALAEKHGMEYRVRGMFEACRDIVDKLDVVAEAYDEFIAMTPPQKKMSAWNNRIKGKSGKKIS